MGSRSISCTLRISRRCPSPATWASTLPSCPPPPRSPPPPPTSWATTAPAPITACPEERQKCENRAERYAIKHYIPREALFEAVNSGLTEYWQLAEHFGFTEDFVRKAVCLYAFGNLSAELYL